MPLPKIDVPIYELELPSNGDKIKYRPFTVKEEKILLTAQESKDVNEMIEATRQIVNNCILDYDFDKLALFDLEYILITMRSKSVDNEVEFKIKDPETDEEVDLKLDLGNVKLQRDPEHTNKIRVDDKYFLFMAYPTIDQFKGILTGETKTAGESFDILVSCMEKLVSEEEVFNFKDFSEKEVNEFINGLQGDVIKGMKKFFDTIPKLRHEISYVNKNGEDKVFVIEGTETFFI